MTEESDGLSVISFYIDYQLFDKSSVKECLITRYFSDNQ